jgi:cytochrome bd-type quinol oxidase subunit 2
MGGIFSGDHFTPFWVAGLFVLPVIAIYTIAVYWFFRGKMRTGYG